jgi:hypothetical protein
MKYHEPSDEGTIFTMRKCAGGDVIYQYDDYGNHRVGINSTLDGMKWGAWASYRNIGFTDTWLGRVYHTSEYYNGVLPLVFIAQEALSHKESSHVR